MSPQPTLPIARDHDLPPRWDGIPVTWRGWQDPTICTMSLHMPPTTCQACGHPGDQPSNIGTVGHQLTLLDSTTTRTPSITTTLCAWRCPTCQLDTVTDLTTGENWNPRRIRLPRHGQPAMTTTPTSVTTDLDAAALAARIADTDRTRPLLVVSRIPGSPTPAADLTTLTKALPADLEVQVYVVNDPLGSRLGAASQPGQEAGVWGSAVRIYPAGEPPEAGYCWVPKAGTSPKAIVEICTGLVATVPGRELHRLRSSDAGNAAPMTRGDGAVCWRAALQRGTPQARRIHFWQRRDHMIELSSVRLNDDMRP